MSNIVPLSLVRRMRHLQKMADPIGSGGLNILDLPFGLHDFGPRGVGGDLYSITAHPNRDIREFIEKLAQQSRVGDPTTVIGSQLLEQMEELFQMPSATVVLEDSDKVGPLGSGAPDKFAEFLHDSYKMSHIIPIPDKSGSMSDLYPWPNNPGRGFSPPASMRINNPKHEIMAVWGRAEDMRKQLPTAQIIPFPKKPPPAD